MTQSMNRNMARTPHRKRKMDTLTKSLLGAFIVIGLVLAFFAGRFVFNLVKGWSMTALPGAPVGSETNGSTTGEIPDINIQTNDGPEAKAWDGKSRVNILLIGLDYSNLRQEQQDQGNPFSDTMILVTVDPFSQSIGALSIRRDLWVNIPGYDYHKINSAYKLGEDYNLPGGGAGLAVKTVEEFLGVPIHFYARVDFDTFVKLIDEIDGVKLEFTEAITADWKGTGEMFTIEPGTYTLPGTYALAYARYRGGDDGDIGRGSRQMQVIQAIFDRVLRFQMLPKLVSRAPAIYQEISAGVQTNMNFDQAIQLASLMVQIPRKNFKTYNIDYSMCSPETISTYEEGVQYILRPFPDKIRVLRDKMFAEGSSATAPVTLNTDDPLALAVQEKARVEFINGTATGGLAEKTGEFFTNKGLNIVTTGNTSDPYDYTVIIVHNATPYTLDYLSKLMKVKSARIYNQFDPQSQADITVYLGVDWVNENPMQ